MSDTPITDQLIARLDSAECHPSCDSYGHHDDCEHANPERVMRVEMEKLERQLAAAKQDINRLSHQLASQQQMQRIDCSWGEMDTGLIHCPPGNPCKVCQLRQEAANARAAAAFDASGVLQGIRGALHIANEPGPIKDTIWYSDAETLFDYIDAELERFRALATVPGRYVCVPVESDSRPCTCHPDDNPPKPCLRKYALSDCHNAAKGKP